MDFITTLAEWLSKNPWGVTTLFILAIVGAFGIPLSVFLYFRGKRSKVLCYAIRSSNLVRNLVSRVDHLEMLYAGQPIENLTATRILLWNAGSETVDIKDIAFADPLVIKVKEGCRILDTKIVYQDPVSQFSLRTTDDQSAMLLSFDYVDRNQGVVINLLHTGQESNDIQVSGRIKGGELASKSLAKMRSNSEQRVNLAYSLFLLIVGSIMLVAGIGPSLLAVLMIVTSLALGGLSARTLYQNKLLKGMDVFQQEL